MRQFCALKANLCICPRSNRRAYEPKCLNASVTHHLYVGYDRKGANGFLLCLWIRGLSLHFCVVFIYIYIYIYIFIYIYIYLYIFKENECLRLYVTSPLSLIILTPWLWKTLSISYCGVLSNLTVLHRHISERGSESLALHCLLSLSPSW